MTDKYFTEEQREFMAKRRVEVTDQRIREVEAEWPRLIAEVRAEMEKGTALDDPRVQALAARWSSLVEEFTGGNLGIAKSVATMYREEPAVRQKTGLDSAIIEYVSRANAFKGLNGQ
jgi:TipAS antibiotic-recognition protein